MIKKVGLVLLSGLVLYSSMATAAIEEEYMFSGMSDPSDSLLGFDMSTFGLGSHLDGMYKVSFDAMIPESDFPPAAFATVSTSVGLAGGVLFGDGPPGADLNGDGMLSSTFMFDATHDIEYFASVVGFESGMSYDLHIALVPEMETWAMMLAGMGFLGWRLRNKQQAS